MSQRPNAAFPAAAMQNPGQNAPFCVADHISTAMQGAISRRRQPAASHYRRTRLY
jgi:hypothetical protein